VELSISPDYNVAVDCLERPFHKKDAVALNYEDDEGNTATYTFGEMRDATNRFANALRSLGVGRGEPEVSAPRNPQPLDTAADRLLDCVADADSVIISAGHQAGQPPLIDDTALRAMRPGAWLVNIARGALLDADAAIAHLNTGHLAGIGLDVFPTEPYPAEGPLVAHPRIVATAHTAALTSDYFAAASRRLGDALAGYLDHQPPAGLLR